VPSWLRSLSLVIARAVVAGRARASARWSTNA